MGVPKLELKSEILISILKVFYVKWWDPSGGGYGGSPQGDPSRLYLDDIFGVLGDPPRGLTLITNSLKFCTDL